ncbi:monooxygenase [Aspergillus luchuensis]|uniref:Monooxygenase n=1 Tax=Aspergillus kawachii TaxID=1069201 RepID=A0A146FY03_ASPKA|nr:monooxygenase [Aspergillus luchuensis]
MGSDLVGLEREERPSISACHDFPAISNTTCGKDSNNKYLGLRILFPLGGFGGRAVCCPRQDDLRSRTHGTQLKVTTGSGRAQHNGTGGTKSIRDRTVHWTQVPLPNRVTVFGQSEPQWMALRTSPSGEG